ncbi:MAG: hypothetical protein PHH37_11520 [Paludibacter sp.]|nr:hypothetical protein [Paludibacter sp.]
MKKRAIYIIILIHLFGILKIQASQAVITESTIAGGKNWILSNDVVLFEIEFKQTSGISLKQFFNKEANKNYIGTNSLLFNYTGQFISTNKNTVPIDFEYKASDADWIYKTHTVEDVVMSRTLSNIVLGKKISITIEKEDIQVKLVFEIFDGRSGLRYQNFIKNKKTDAKLMIEKSDVISLDLPNNAHNIHYVTNNKWLSTTGNIEESPTVNNADDAVKCLINLYDTNDGWYIAPEVNWKTQYGPEISNKQETPSYYYQFRPFAIPTAWASETSGVVKVMTCPESFQLVLFPDEEFEYIAVNITAFKGDIVDGKMAVEEHFRKRFRFHDTTTSLMVNDWDWFSQGLRTEDYFYNTVFPKAKKAGYDIILIDDGWNNASTDGKWITDDNYTRDPIVSNTPGIPDMKVMADSIKKNGFRLGLWYSNSGGGHNKGHDLADPAVLAAKKVMLQTMIDNYDLKHQAVDLTQYWQNLDETSYSHPSDNVYRKNVLTRNMMNDVVEDNPDYEIKVTSELDIYPNPNDRMTDLMHLPNNGWMTITGTSKPVDGIGIHFGHLPLNAIYLGSGGDPVEKTDELYAILSARDVKAYKLPTNWSDAGLNLFGLLNTWRKGTRIKALTDNIVRPVFLGQGWANADASQWDREVAPYIWMYTNDEKNSAFLIATAGGRSVVVPPANYPLRWLDNTKTYLVEDVTLDDTDIFTYAFKGKYTGSELNTNGLNINLYENTSPAKAYWFQELKNVEKQVIFADQNITSYTETIQGNDLIINADGVPNSTGVIVVYGKTEDDAMTCNLTFNNQGIAQLTISTITNNDVPFPGDSGDPIRLEFENFQTTIEKSNQNITVSAVNNGNPDSENGQSSLAKMIAVGDSVIYKMTLPFAGQYNVKINYKISLSSRGVAQFSYVDSSGKQTLLGGTQNQATTSTETMTTFDAGNITVNTAGTVKIVMKLVGGSGTWLSGNYIIFTKE